MYKSGGGSGGGNSNPKTKTKTKTRSKTRSKTISRGKFTNKLKRQAEKMQEKMEVIGLNIINYLKFKTDTDDRVTKLEKMMVKCFTTDQFREESQLTE